MPTQREPKRVALRMNVFFISKELLRRGPAESDVCMRRICGGVVQEIAKGFSPGAERACNLSSYGAHRGVNL